MVGGPFPTCWFRTLTGKPCLTCGTTRLLLALTRGEWTMAWRWNPLVFGGLLVLMGWGLLGLASWLTGWEGEQRCRRWLAQRKGFVLAGALMAALANWVYLWTQHGTRP